MIYHLILLSIACSLVNINGTRWENDSVCYTKVTTDNKNRNKTKNLGKALKLGKSLNKKCWGQNIYSEIPINYNLCPWTYFCVVSYGSAWQKSPSFIYLAHSVCFLIQTYKIFTNCHVYKHEFIFVWGRHCCCFDMSQEAVLLLPWYWWGINFNIWTIWLITSINYMATIMIIIIIILL